METVTYRISTVCQNVQDFNKLLTVLTGYKFDVKSVVDVIVKHSCTHIMLTPTMLIDILNYVEKNDVKITSLKGTCRELILLELS